MHFRGCTFCFKLLAALVTLGIAQAAATSEALASCGDWLAEHSPQEAPFLPGEGDLTDQPLAPQPRPCDGPQCRQAPAPPLPTAPVRLVQDFKDGCYLLEGALAAMRSPRPSSALEDDLLPDSLTQPRIDRPPRS